MLKTKKMLIVGGTGSLSQTMIDFYHEKYHITIFSRDASKHLLLKNKYGSINCVIGDMKNIIDVRNCLVDIDPHIIIINGALKHIDYCEQNIAECLETNVNGVQNVINNTLLQQSDQLEKVIYISSDKSCNPVSVYGLSKAIGERMLVEASTKSKNIKYVNIRIPNLLNSNGSLIPKFIEIGQSPNHFEFTVTDRDMTRFFITLEDCVDLIDVVIGGSNSGETWVPSAYSFKIIDLALFFSEIYNKPIKMIGSRPGEKIHESIINEVEINRTHTSIINSKKYYVINPYYMNQQFKDILVPLNSHITHNLEDLHDTISQFLPSE